LLVNFIVFSLILPYYKNIFQRCKMMKPKKRLFLFASFDQDNIIDDTVIYYVTKLSEIGDVVFVMDNDLPKGEIEKITNIPNVLYANATRHGEYDFGSYKRGYLWAKENDVLEKYDWVYFVNDSVYGPLYDLGLVICNLESSGKDLIGMTSNYDKNTPWHIQSWFIGFSKKVFTESFFNKFIKNITHIANKTALIMKYEAGLSWLIIRHGFSACAVLDTENNNVYEEPRSVLIGGVPFVKKGAISKLRKLYFLYPHIEDDILLDYIIAHMQRYNIKMVKDSFRDIYEFRLFGIPVFSISAKKPKYYKIYLFKRIPIMKIVKKG